MGRGGRHSCGPHREETTLFSTPFSSPAATPTLSTTLEPQVTLYIHVHTVYSSSKHVKVRGLLTFNLCEG